MAAVDATSCAYCGAGISGMADRRRAGGRRFCGRPCYDALRSAGVAARVKRCAQCGEPFDAYPSGRKYCCHQCRVDAKRVEPKNCLNCGCLFTPIKTQATGVIVGYSAGKTCSRKCHIEWIKRNPERKRKIGEAFRGDRHPNWQGGKSLLNNVSGRGPGWQSQRVKALNRDGYKCVDCGMTDGECRARWRRGLDVDHIVPFHNFSSARAANALGNLASRCASCHRIAEARRSMVQMMLPMQDGERRQHKGRAGKGNSRLSVADVLAIRARAGAGESASTICNDFPAVRNRAIRDIVARRTWKAA